MYTNACIQTLACTVQLVCTTCESMYTCYHIIHRDCFEYQTNFQVSKITAPSVSAKSYNKRFSTYAMQTVAHCIGLKYSCISLFL